MPRDSRFSSDVAAGYDETRGVPESVAAAFHEQVVAATGLCASDRVLDVGAGTGTLSGAFLRSGYRYVGLDSSAEMLARFRGRLARGDSVALAQGDAASLPFAEAGFDLVLALRSLGIVPGWRRAVRECLRVLRPGGSLVAGRIDRGPQSLHALLRSERNRLLAAFGVDTSRPGADDDVVLAELVQNAAEHTPLPPVAWHARVVPRRQIDGTLAGWRILALASDVQADLRRQLTERVRERYGDVDEPVEEEATLALHHFRVR